MIVGYETALNYWRVTRTASVSQQVPDPEGRVYGALPLSVSERARLALNLCSSEAPLQVVIPRANERHALPVIENHVWKGPLTSEHLISLGSDIFVCRMPAVLCQLAAKLDVVDLAEIACEILGTYGLAPWTESGSVGDLAPLVDLAELRGYAASAHALGVRGSARALEALSLAVAGSNSPRETCVAVFLQRSRPLGGAGLGGFAMNQRVTLPDRLAKRLGRRVVIPDFSWPNGTLMEYDSKREHLDPETRARDEAKRRAYRAEGLDCLTLTNGILRSNALLDLFVADLEQSLGLKRRPMSGRMESSRRDLRERLFGPETTSAAIGALNGAAR